MLLPTRPGFLPRRSRQKAGQTVHLPQPRILLERVLASSYEFGESCPGFRSAVMNHHEHLRALAAHGTVRRAPLALGVPACQSLGETWRDLVVQERPPLALAYVLRPTSTLKTPLQAKFIPAKFFAQGG
jgi:hypothetical protein